MKILPDMASPSASAIMRVLETARRKLLETGTRNRLVHVNRANTRSSSLNVVNEKSDDVYAILQLAGKRMRFQALGRDKPRKALNGDLELIIDGAPEDDGLVLAAVDTAAQLDGSRFKDDCLETLLGPEALARRLLGMAKDARVAEEEQGLNILFMALGFLRWKESTSSQVVREAPLVLLPVELVRNEKTSSYHLKAREDDISTNLPLQERLRQDFGIGLPEIDEAEGWVPSHYFKLVQQAISGKNDWSVDFDGVQLGFFSFAKLLMHHDLDLSKWPEGMFEKHDLLNGLMLDGFESEEPIFPRDAKLDQLLDPADIIQVVDADASQTKVIEEVRRGANLVVQGPPGTGKSQTITNILAAAAHDGKTVLFVAEKMAALSVVHNRLVKSGLQDICLELHSRTANKKAVAQELGRTLAASAKTVPAAADPHGLRSHRNELNNISGILHAPLNESGDTPFQAMAEIIGFIGDGKTAPIISQRGLDTLGRTQRQDGRRALWRLRDAISQTGDPKAHPFRGTKALHLQPPDLARIELQLRQTVSEILELRTELERVATVITAPCPESFAATAPLSAAVRALCHAPSEAQRSLDVLFDLATESRLQEALNAGHAWKRAQDASEGIFTSSAWSTAVNDLRKAIVAGKASIFQRWFGPYKRASAELGSLLNDPLPKDPGLRLALVDQLLDVQHKRSLFAGDEGWLQENLKDHWRGERTRFDELSQVCLWLVSVRSAGTFSSAAQLSAALGKLPDPLQEADHLEKMSQVASQSLLALAGRLDLDLIEAGFDAPLMEVKLTSISDTLTMMLRALSSYGDWVNLKLAIKNAETAGAAGVVEAVLKGAIAPESGAHEFMYACAESRWTYARRERPGLESIRDVNRHELSVSFGRFEQDRIRDARNLVRQKHFDAVPKGSAGEMGIIRGEIGRKKGHKSIRWLMQNAGAMVQRIKPVLLMSPISVAQFLPAGAVTFDLLVIDEASQIRPEDALGCIARARQVVVVGDQKQLPPTSFFSRLLDDADDDQEEDEGAGASAAEMESILTLFEARGVNRRMLTWHYRSRDPSLIRVSNAEFYDDELVLPPSPLQLDDNFGLKLKRVSGVYAPKNSGLGRAGTNRLEAEAVAKAVALHARNSPSLSLGVVAFSKVQSDMITEVLENDRRKDGVLDAFLQTGKSEDVFIKNIENVQGDERDVILISVGYGPQTVGGRLTSMSFGPINGEGGGRRLNVLFSRARSRCEVFASFDPADIDPQRSGREGVRILKRFLEFARTGILDERVVTGLDADSPFEEDVAKVIRSLGYEADPQVGSSGFRVDIGVRHPEQPAKYLLAVECDGAAYHSALWARERDRLRQEVLESLGWQFHRIWSTDWFYHRQSEINRLQQVLASAKLFAENECQTVDQDVASSYREGSASAAQTIGEEPISLDHLTMRAPPYLKAKPVVHAMAEPHETPIELLSDLVLSIVEIEGPVHVEEIARRVAAAFGKNRTGSRIVTATERAISHALRRHTNLHKEGSFVLSSSQLESMPIRDRSATDGNLIKAEFLPPLEIVAAAKLITQESGTMADADLVKAIANLLGFQRVGPDLARIIGKAVEFACQPT